MSYFYLPETRGVPVPDDIVEVGILHKRTERMGFFNLDYGIEQTWHQLRLDYGESARDDGGENPKHPLLAPGKASQV